MHFVAQIICFLVPCSVCSLLLNFLFLVADDSNLDEVWVLGSIDVHHSLHHHPLLTILFPNTCGGPHPEVHEVNTASGSGMGCAVQVALLLGVHQHVQCRLGSLKPLEAETVPGAQGPTYSPVSRGSKSIFLHSGDAWK